MLQWFYTWGLKIRAFALKFGYAIRLLMWISECLRKFPLPSGSDDDISSKVEEVAQQEREIAIAQETVIEQEINQESVS